mmetsp:Transcript_28694/g.96667  ORF Transcript_28694/g.96667 Transcript_28694/m.96667 type:complete len:205 (-) Transcript_28694:216-830(-)
MLFQLFLGATVEGCRPRDDLERRRSFGDDLDEGLGGVHASLLPPGKPAAVELARGHEEVELVEDQRLALAGKLVAVQRRSMLHQPRQLVRRRHDYARSRQPLRHFVHVRPNRRRRHAHDLVAFGKQAPNQLLVLLRDLPRRDQDQQLASPPAPQRRRQRRQHHCKRLATPSRRVDRHRLAARRASAVGRLLPGADLDRRGNGVP